MYPDSHGVSVMLQQAVPCIDWRDLLKGTSPIKRPGLKGNISNTGSHQIDCHTYLEHNIPLCRVDFTQYHFFSGTNYVYLVFILIQEVRAVNWVFLGQEGNAQHVYVYPCIHVPSGPIQIIDSMYMHVYCHSQNDSYAGGSTDPNIVYQNFKQDCHCFKLHGVAFE